MQGRAGAAMGHIEGAHTNPLDQLDNEVPQIVPLDSVRKIRR